MESAETAFQNYQYEFVLCYADDVLVYTKTASVDDHIEHLEKVFERLDKYGLRLKASKLRLAAREIPFLGVLVNEDGIKTNPEKTKAITDLPVPKTLDQLRRALGMFADYRKFIGGFEALAAPLYAQTGKGVQNKRKKDETIELTEEARGVRDAQNKDHQRTYSAVFPRLG